MLFSDLFLECVSRVCNAVQIRLSFWDATAKKLTN